jgi:hypothetical protein
MRKTLHEYVIEQGLTSANSDIRFLKAIQYAALTDRAPELEDFIHCDDEGNVLKKPDRLHYSTSEIEGGLFKSDNQEYQEAKDRVIFKGDWEVVKGSNSNHTRIYCEQLHTTIDFELSGISLIRTDRSGFVLERGAIDRIEDLPREIEFKDGLI